MAWFLGIDIGSRTSKGIIVSEGKQKSSLVFATDVDYRITAQKLRDELLNKASLHQEDIVYTITTGHGGGIIPFSNRHMTDIQCCAMGMSHIFPEVRTIIDVQGQSSQAIKLDGEGQVVNFMISEICAGGSGRFLDVITNVLQIDLEKIGELSLESTNPVSFTTGCAVFGESEAVSMVAEGIPKEDILGGVHKAVAGKLFSLMERVGLEEPCAISGGGGLNIGLIRRLEGLGVRLLVPPQPQLVNALGAALIAEREH
ncbi:MAG: hypothetical protein JW967_08155 [Dehalococcoidales bacterium]|nr:hypothetical protein [Dehalococcoidales bacterium]